MDGSRWSTSAEIVHFCFESSDEPEAASTGVTGHLSCIDAGSEPRFGRCALRSRADPILVRALHCGGRLMVVTSTHAHTTGEPTMSIIRPEVATGDVVALGVQATRRVVPRRDVFISHASDDKRAIARPLAERLRVRGCSVWFEDDELALGDSRRTRIGDGLRHSHVGVVILSHSFFNDQRSRWELDGLTARHMAGEQNVILPVWHGVTLDEVRLYSLPLADLHAARSSDGVDAIADAVIRVLARRAAMNSRADDDRAAYPS